MNLLQLRLVPLKGSPACDTLSALPWQHEMIFTCMLVGVAWSIADPWTFASLSYDGRFSVHQVPSQTKYKILI